MTEIETALETLEGVCEHIGHLETECRTVAKAMTSKLTILVIEDNPDTSASLALCLEAFGHTVLQAPSLAKADALLKVVRPEAMVLDLNLADSRGTGTLSAMQAAHAEIPIVVYSGMGDLETKLEAIRRGAQEFAVKGRDDPIQLNDLVKIAIVRHQVRPTFAPLQAALKAVGNKADEMEQFNEDIAKKIRDRPSSDKKGGGGERPG